MRVFCPLCHRQVRLSGLGAVDMEGDPVMEWHYGTGGSYAGECQGSNRSVQAAEKIAAEDE